MKIVFYNKTLLSGGIEKCLELLSKENINENQFIVEFFKFIDTENDNNIIDDEFDDFLTVSEYTEKYRFIYDVVYKTDEWIIVRPNTYEAELKIGQGCKWCTANGYGNGLDYWNRYLHKGPLWVNFDLRNGGEIAPMNNKEYPYKRYQFCFESSITGEFTNYAGGEFYGVSGTETQEVVKVSHENYRTWNEASINFSVVPPTGMTTAQTIYFMGLILLLSGVGIVYANAKPKTSE